MMTSPKAVNSGQTEREAWDVALDALDDYQRNWDTGLPAEYASGERIAMECTVEAVREALNEARAASTATATGEREFHQAAVQLVRDMLDLMPSFSMPGGMLARVNALLTAPAPVAEQADEAADDRLAKLLAHCSDMGMTYDRQSRVKVIRATFKINEQTSDFLQEQFSLIVDEFIDNAARAKDSK